MNSSIFCWVIDCLINVNKVGWWKEKITQFGLELLKRGVNLDQVLNVELFAEAPRTIRPGSFRYDVFPRNSGITCREAVCMLAYLNPYFAELHKAMR